MTLKIANIVGARPQFIKYYPLMKAIRAFNATSGNAIEERLIHTGQHYDYSLSKVFFDELSLQEPNVHLGVKSGSHAVQTAQIITKVEEALVEHPVDCVVVFGDTNTTLGAALAAVKLNIPVAHIEAGLRSRRKFMAEEINRVIVDRVSEFLFCPSTVAVDNLRGEGFENVEQDGRLYVSSGDLSASRTSSALQYPRWSNVFNTGDLMYDAILDLAKIAEKRSTITNTLQLQEKDYYLLTLHRAESTDSASSLEERVNFVNEISKGKTVIFPMHPRTKKAYSAIDARFTNNVRILEPVGYFDLIHLMRHAELVLTDSGGMQKEAYWLKTPCITLRDETEWIETVNEGWNILYKNYRGKHVLSTSEPLCYGDGKAAERIVKILANIGTTKSESRK